MRSLYPTLRELVGRPAPVVVEGEPGVGKRLLAIELHRRSRGPDAPFVVFDLRSDRRSTDNAKGTLDLLAVAANARTALTRALADARTGTLYVPEGAALDAVAIGEIARAVTATELTRLVVATRHSDVAERLARRLSVRNPCAHLVLPPLRERGADVVVLALRFWVELGGRGRSPTSHALRAAPSPWPGNVRELRATVAAWIQRGFSGDDDVLTRILERDLTLRDARHEFLAEFERRYVARALSRAGGDTQRAARASGIGQRYLQALRSRHS
jgi:DNA-binding NtrC family response regulator